MSNNGKDLVTLTQEWNEKQRAIRQQEREAKQAARQQEREAKQAAHQQEREARKQQDRERRIEESRQRDEERAALAERAREHRARLRKEVADHRRQGGQAHNERVAAEAAARKAERARQARERTPEARGQLLMKMVAEWSRYGRLSDKTEREFRIANSGPSSEDRELDPTSDAGMDAARATQPEDDPINS